LWKNYRQHIIHRLFTTAERTTKGRNERRKAYAYLFSTVGFVTVLADLDCLYKQVQLIKTVPPPSKRYTQHSTRAIHSKPIVTMSSRNIFSKTADVLHRGVVLGLLSAFGYHFYQIISKTSEGRIDSPHMHSTYLKGK